MGGFIEPGTYIVNINWVRLGLLNKNCESKLEVHCVGRCFNKCWPNNKALELNNHLFC